MIKTSRWYSCINTPPKKDGDYLVVRFDDDGSLAYAGGVHYTMKYGWNTYESSTKPSTFFDKKDEYDRACMWTVITKETSKKKRRKAKND